MTEYRVTCRGLTPHYFQGRNAALDAHRYATGRTHLHPVTHKRTVYRNQATGPWLKVEHAGATP